MRTTTIGAILMAVCTLSFPHDNPPPAPPPENGGHFWLTPDNNGGRGFHIVSSAVLGAALQDYAPEWGILRTWATCQLPGVFKEVVLDTGVSRSDLRSNALGCGLGMVVHGVSLRVTGKTHYLTWETKF